MNKQTVYLAGGCFWGMEGYFRQIKGILSTEVGYANGFTADPTYKDVCNNSGHAEVVKLTYDKDHLINEELFNLFLRVINPYSVNEQGEDKGVQYRTGIFTEVEAELLDFAALLEKFEEANKKTAIELMPLHNYTPAEENHQEYLLKNPTGYCHINLHNIPNEFKKAS